MTNLPPGLTPHDSKVFEAANSAERVPSREAVDTIKEE